MINNNLIQKIVTIFSKTEKWLAIVLGTLIFLIVLSALYRVILSTIEVIEINLTSPESSNFKLYTDSFGKILTLFISIEFMNAIIDIAKKREIKKLLNDVIIITGLALCRKLIVMDYKELEPLYIFGFAAILISLGVLYFFVSGHTKN